MILSDNQLFSYNQQVAGADEQSTNIIDTGDVGDPGDDDGVLASHDIGPGNPVEFIAQIGSVAAAGAAAFTVQVITGATESAGVIQSPVVLAQSDIANADIAVGATANLRFIPNKVQRYLGLNYVVNSDVNVDVTVTAGINLGQTTNRP